MTDNVIDFEAYYDRDAGLQAEIEEIVTNNPAALRHVRNIFLIERLALAIGADPAELRLAAQFLESRDA